jgi:hypothetical protein
VIGFGRQAPLSSGSAIYFAQNIGVNSGNWQCISTTSFGTGSLTTTVNTAITPGGGIAFGFDNLQIVVNAAGTSIQFFINHVLATTITTHIPTTGPMTPLIYCAGSTISTSILNILEIDEFDLTIVLTDPR